MSGGFHKTNIHTLHFGSRVEVEQLKTTHSQAKKKKSLAPADKAINTCGWKVCLPPSSYQLQCR